MKRAETILIFLTLGVILLAVNLNRMNMEIRIEEMKSYIQSGNRTDNNIDHVSLLMKYKIHKDLYDGKINDSQSATIEAKILNAVSTANLVQTRFKSKYPVLSYPVIHIINSVRFLLELPPIRFDATSPDYFLPEIAYYYERNSNYRKAVELYEEILTKKNPESKLRASILLHQGYCLSILGKYKEARSKYISIIKNYGHSKIAVTAALLLRYIDGFKKEINKIMTTEKDSLEKGEKLHRLIAYRESLAVLNKIEKNSTKSEKEKIAFFRGRAQEELGNEISALKSYQKIITTDPSSDLAVAANRRIFLMGRKSITGKTYEKLASENNKKIKDRNFREFSKTYKFYKEDDVQSLIIKTIESDKDEKESEKTRLDTAEKILSKVISKNRESKAKTTSLKITKKIKIKIYTADGNIFTGYIEKENKKNIIMKSSLGLIIINKKDVKKRVKMR